MDVDEGFVYGIVTLKFAVEDLVGVAFLGVIRLGEIDIAPELACDRCKVYENSPPLSSVMVLTVSSRRFIMPTMAFAVTRNA